MKQIPSKEQRWETRSGSFWVQGKYFWKPVVWPSWLLWDTLSPCDDFCFHKCGFSTWSKGVQNNLQQQRSPFSIGFWTAVLEKTLESPLDCKEIQPVHAKGDQSWIFIGKTDVEAETPILWPPDVKSWLIWKDPDAGKDWRQEEKGTTEDEMVGWHHRLNWHEFDKLRELVIGKPGVLQSMGSQRVGHDWANWTELNGNELNWTQYFQT